MNPTEDNAAGLDDRDHCHGDTGGNESILDRPGDAGEHNNRGAAGVSQNRIGHGCASCSFLDAFHGETRHKTFPTSETIGK